MILFTAIHTASQPRKVMLTVSARSMDSLARNRVSMIKVILAMGVDIRLWTTIQGCPLWLIFEESHSRNVLHSISGVETDQTMDVSHVVAVSGKSMVDTSRKYLAYV